jgi:hypothetical protein
MIDDNVKRSIVIELSWINSEVNQAQAEQYVDDVDTYMAEHENELIQQIKNGVMRMRIQRGIQILNRPCVPEPETCDVDCAGRE